MPEARRLAIIGYGKMGRLIEQLAPEYGFTVTLRLDEFNNTNYEGVTAENFRGIDVAVDFSIPAAVVENVERISALGVSIVVGTTGWTEHLARVQSAVEKRGIGGSVSIENHRIKLREELAVESFHGALQIRFRHHAAEVQQRSALRNHANVNRLQ